MRKAAYIATIDGETKPVQLDPGLVQIALNPEHHGVHATLSWELIVQELRSAFPHRRLPLELSPADVELRLEP